LKTCKRVFKRPRVLQEVVDIPFLTNDTILQLDCVLVSETYATAHCYHQKDGVPVFKSYVMMNFI